MQIATITFTADGIEIASPYSAAFVADLKAAIPYGARSWEPAVKRWRIDPAWSDVALEVTKRYFTVKEIDKKSQQQQSGHSASSPHSILHLLPSAPPELIQAAYRTLAKLLHPDHGGSTEAMQKLNAAYQKVSK